MTKLIEMYLDGFGIYKTHITPVAADIAKRLFDFAIFDHFCVSFLSAPDSQNAQCLNQGAKRSSG